LSAGVARAPAAIVVISVAKIRFANNFFNNFNGRITNIGS